MLIHFAVIEYNGLQAIVTENRFSKSAYKSSKKVLLKPAEQF